MRVVDLEKGGFAVSDHPRLFTGNVGLAKDGTPEPPQQ